MPDYATGPAPHPTPGPVLEAYADTDALDRECPNCRAPVNEFCRHESGVERKVPCVARTR